MLRVHQAISGIQIQAEPIPERIPNQVDRITATLHQAGLIPLRASHHQGVIPVLPDPAVEVIHLLHDPVVAHPGHPVVAPHPDLPAGEGDNTFEY